MSVAKQYVHTARMPAPSYNVPVRVVVRGSSADARVYQGGLGRGGAMARVHVIRSARVGRIIVDVNRAEKGEGPKAAQINSVGSHLIADAGDNFADDNGM